MFLDWVFDEFLSGFDILEGLKDTDNDITDFCERKLLPKADPRATIEWNIFPKMSFLGFIPSFGNEFACIFASELFVALE